jgi:hypothetical protein
VWTPPTVLIVAYISPAINASSSRLVVVIAVEDGSQMEPLIITYVHYITTALIPVFLISWKNKSQPLISVCRPSSLEQKQLDILFGTPL